MTTGYICDRCGETFKSGGKWLQGGYHGNSTPMQSWDLCQDCMEGFAAWMDRGQESQDVTCGIERVTESPELLHDTREKLEADLKTHLYEFGGYCFSSREGHTDNVDTFFDDFVFLLDRQAAITERETLHSHPMCAGSDTCPALNRPIGESADRETPDTAGIGASKDEIRDFDVWNVAYEIYCAGGYVDNGNEPNPPTDGIRELLDRQAAITERETKLRELYRFEENHREHVRSIEAVNQELNAQLADARESLDMVWSERDQWRDAYKDSERMRLDLVKDLEHARRWNDTWRDLVRRYEGLCDELLDERDRLRGELP